MVGVELGSNDGVLGGHLLVGECDSSQSSVAEIEVFVRLEFFDMSTGHSQEIIGSSYKEISQEILESVRKGLAFVLVEESFGVFEEVVASESSKVKEE